MFERQLPQDTVLGQKITGSDAQRVQRQGSQFAEGLEHLDVSRSTAAAVKIQPSQLGSPATGAREMSRGPRRAKVFERTGQVEQPGDVVWFPRVTGAQRSQRRQLGEPVQVMKAPVRPHRQLNVLPAAQ